ncbi:phosphatidylglycerol lysyltransferase domain-containing protein [Brevibacillus fulvus]|uniref:Phosphatidylglycerol lysyltransferase C-terminal domain-containing protein n=1 Tax=Brevibacillus fulvus TaxID=1125967 RepID=A0A938XY32_9BACL|nr:phosphatidylglycerol lysyltransferase domain-containing protein [Brevibacillus fulvus]MBM7590289.1 hypothetical protein [Brevibacillus fulvus]
MKLLQNQPRRVVLRDWAFRKIRLRDREMFIEFQKQCDYPLNLWSANFDYLWADSQSREKKVMWRIVDGMLVPFVLMRKGGLHLVCLPFGKGTAEQVLQTVYRCLRFCNRWNRGNGFSMATIRTVNAAQLEFLQQSDKMGKYFDVMQIRGKERHFGIQNLVKLAGKDFARIREAINKFKREHPTLTVRRYTDEDFRKLLRVNENWRKTAGKKYSLIFDGVYFEQILKRHKELEHIILVVEIDEKIVGMVTGGLTPAGNAWGCLTKRLEGYNGINEFMMVEFAREINRVDPSAELLNVGSDLGVPGLVAFKEKFRPVLSLERYRVRLK